MFDSTSYNVIESPGATAHAPAQLISGAHLLHLAGVPGATRIREILAKDRADIVVRWHRQNIGDVPGFTNPTTGFEIADPYVADLLAIPISIIAEVLGDKGIDVPTRQQCRNWAAADLHNGGEGVDPEVELEAARLTADPDLRGEIGAEEPRICGVPKSIFALLQPDEQQKVLSGLVIAPPRAPLSVARWLVRNHFSKRGGVPGRRGRAWMRLVIRVDQTWYTYATPRGGGQPRWIARTDPELMPALLQQILGKLWYVHVRRVDGREEYSLKWWNPDATKLGMVEKALAGELAAGSGTHARELPDRYGRVHHAYKGTRVLCRSGVLNLDTGDVDVATPLWFSLSCIEADYDHADDSDADCAWRKVLQAQWPDDPAALECLQEWFGYVLSGSIDLQKFMLIIGPRGSAKSLIAGVLSALVGNVVELGLEALNSHFGLQNAYETGAMLGVMSDMRFGARDSSLAVARLLAITGCDEVSIDRKHKGVVTANLAVRLHGSANELPRLGDHSGALVDRMLALETRQSFRGTPNEDPGLKDRIIANELGLVLRWAVEGLARLMANGGVFTRSKAAAELASDALDEFSNVRQFVEQCCELGTAEDYVDLQVLFRNFGKWARENKTGERMSQNAFSKALKSMNMAPIKPGQKKMPPGKSGKWLVVYGITRASVEYIDRDRFGNEIPRTVTTDGDDSGRGKGSGGDPFGRFA
jgi:putative DNA primase/helicase